MPVAWKWKVSLLLVLILASIYLLIPTVFNFREKAEFLAAQGFEQPWYFKLFHQKGLNLGLDLRGGIYLEFEVDLKDAVLNKLELISDELNRNFQGEKIDSRSTTDLLDGKIIISSESGSDLARASDMILNRYKEILEKSKMTEKGLSFSLTSSYSKLLHDEIAKQSVEKVRNRIDRYGVSEPTIRRLGSNRIAVELPGVKDPDRAVDLIKKAGKLEFKIVDESMDVAQLKTLILETQEKKSLSKDDYTSSTVEIINDHLYQSGKLSPNRQISFEILRDPVTSKITGGRPFLLERKTELTGNMLKNAMVDFENNNPYISITFDMDGTRVFGKLTSENVGKRLAIVLDGAVSSAPVIKDAIEGGRAQITLGIGDFNSLKKEAEDLTLVLQEGALPAKLTEATKTVIGPSLGADSIKKGITATILASIVVALFMLIYYKGSGVIANVALAFNLLFIMSALALFQATLTLPGIAGIALTLGMAVDANVLIYERMKEEARLGKTARSVVDAGYSNALRAIIDSNVTTIIAGVVLYQFGTGPIRGFAVTLIIGLTISMYTACVCTRLAFDYLTLKRNVSKISV